MAPVLECDILQVMPQQMLLFLLLHKFPDWWKIQITSTTRCHYYSIYIHIHIHIFIYTKHWWRGEILPTNCLASFWSIKSHCCFFPKHIALAVVPKSCWDVRELNCLAVNWWNDMRIKNWEVGLLFQLFWFLKNKTLFSVPLHFNAIHLTINHLQSLLFYSDLVLFLDWNLRSFRLCLCQSIHVLLILRAGVSVWSFSVLVSMNSLHNNDKMRPCWSNNPQMEYPPEV